MSRTDKDQPFKHTGIWTHRYWTSPKGHGAWARKLRRRRRAHEQHELRQSREPQPRSPIGHLYYD